MNDQFDELAKGLAQSVTRRGALKKFGLGLAGIALAALGLASTAQADPNLICGVHCRCHQPDFGCGNNNTCITCCLRYGCQSMNNF